MTAHADAVFQQFLIGLGAGKCLIAVPWVPTIGTKGSSGAQAVKVIY